MFVREIGTKPNGKDQAIPHVKAFCIFY